MADRESTIGPIAEAGTKRMRPWLRRVGVVVGCLLAGAIINVLVAWGLAGYDARGKSVHLFLSHAEHPAWFISDRRGFGRRSLHRIDAMAPGAPGDPLNTLEVEELPRWSRADARPTAIDRGNPTYYNHEYVFGWPFQSMYWTRIRGTNYYVLETRGRRLPLVPLIAGTVANSVIYGVCVGLLVIIPFMLRRRKRLQCGLCPDCGYDLRGADHGKCPECGEAVAAK